MTGEILRGAVGRVSDMVRQMFPRSRGTLTVEERDLAVHFRGNDRLHEALVALIRSRIQGRDNLPVPSDPMMCRSILDRNAELRWLLGRLEFLYRSKPNEGADEGELPAA